MSRLKHSKLEEVRTQAAILLKHLRSNDPTISARAAERFAQLPRLRNEVPAKLAQSPHIKLKHALAVIAAENGYSTWADFKHASELRQARRQAQFTLLYPPHCMGFTNEWHTDYDVASQELGREGGFLLPYRDQFFICQASYIEALGLDPNDPDWTAIGYDWVRPADRAAQQRLEAKLRAVATGHK